MKPILKLKDLSIGKYYVNYNGAIFKYRQINKFFRCFTVDSLESDMTINENLILSIEGNKLNLYREANKKEIKLFKLAEIK